MNIREAAQLVAEMDSSYPSFGFSNLTQPFKGLIVRERDGMIFVVVGRVRMTDGDDKDPAKKFWINGTHLKVITTSIRRGDGSHVSLMDMMLGDEFHPLDEDDERYRSFHSA